LPAEFLVSRLGRNSTWSRAVLPGKAGRVR